MGQLPQWAQKSILDTNIPIIEKSSRSVEAPKGRWAQRAHLEPNYDVPMLDRNFYSHGSMSKGNLLVIHYSIRNMSGLFWHFQSHP
jgi:hypothetical protein